MAENEEKKRSLRVQLFWDPSGQELDAIGTKRYLRCLDGDTPYVAMNIRLLSIDTPEVHYPGRKKTSSWDEALAQLAEWIWKGAAPIDAGLAEYLYPKLATGRAGSWQEEQGQKARAFLERLIRERLYDEGRRRRPRSVFLRVAEEPFDRYGRLLVYMAPYYTPEERAGMDRRQRATLNLLMVEAGWAAPFPIFPNLPRHEDLELLREVAEEAYRQRRGIWQEPNGLTGYEFRMSVRLYEVTERLMNGARMSETERSGWISRYCVDMTTREIFYPQRYFRVPPYHRVFVRPEDVNRAVSQLNLVPGE